MHVVTEWGEGACHAVRSAVAAAIALEKGFLAAAHYLGDDVETVRGTYGFLDGTAVDATDLAGVSDLPGFKLEVPQRSRSGVALVPERGEATTTAPHGVLALQRKPDLLAGQVANGEIGAGAYKEQVMRLEAVLITRR